MLGFWKDRADKHLDRLTKQKKNPMDWQIIKYIRREMKRGH